MDANTTISHILLPTEISVKSSGNSFFQPTPPLCGCRLFSYPAPKEGPEMYGPCMSDLIDTLLGAGFANACPVRIRHAIAARHIDRPPKDGSLNYRFSEHNIRQIKAYLSAVPEPGRPRKEKKTEVAA